MNLEELRARLGEIFDLINGFGEDLTDEQMEQVNALHAEYKGLKNKIEVLEKKEEMTSTISAPQPKVKKPAPVTSGVRERIEDDPKRGFESSGEFYKVVANASRNRSDIDKRLYNHKEKVGEEGGFLIPDEFRSEIQKKVAGDESLLSKTTQLTISGNSLVLPTNENAPWDGNGFQAYWKGESKSSTESKDNFGESSYRLHKLSCNVRASEELLDDAAALASWINANAPDAIMHKTNSAIVNGDGVGKPKGLLSSGFRETVAAEGGQAVDTVVYENIVKMMSRMLPGSMGRAVWLINPAVREQLHTMAFKSGVASPVPVYLPPSGLAEAPFGTLAGRPILPLMGAMPQLGDEGDIVFADLSYYYSVLKSSGIQSSQSTHVYFDTDEIAFKFQFRMDGQCPYSSPVTTEFGSYDMSGIVTLAAR